MKELVSNDPIVAVSTGTTEKSALGIIRLSGFENLSFLVELTGKDKHLHSESHKVYFSHFYDADGSLLDEGVFTYFKAPRSFSGENTLELTVHGNPFNIERIVQSLISRFGFRMAQPGEFTLRALRNKKLNLTQVEGLDLLLNASSEFGLSSGLKALNNELYDSYLELRHKLLEMKSSVELLIDFAEDVGEDEAKAKLLRDFSDFSELVSNLHKRCSGDLNDLLSPSVSLIGATNAGKSTFFNRLLGKNRAIVSDVHGTTRDYISEYIYLGGQPFRLIDTAGLRDGAEEIERIGIEKSLEINRTSFYKILLINPLEGENVQNPVGEDISVDAVLLSHADDDQFDKCISIFIEKYPEVPIYYTGSIGPDFDGGPMGANWTSGPIGPDSDSGPMGAKLTAGSIGPSSKSGPIGAISNRILSGPMGAEETLEKAIYKKYQLLKEDNPISIQRHRDVISDIYTELNNINLENDGLDDSAILSHHFNILSRSMDELIGVISPDEVLNHIFDNFCIGK